MTGHTPSELAGSGSAVKATSIATTSPSDCNGPGCAIGIGINSDGMTLVLSVVTLAIVLPILVFIGVATRLSAAAREQRFAAMRLLGATPRQVARVSLAEASAASVVGVGLGFALFFAVRTPVASLPFTGSPFFPSDLSLSWPDIVAVILGVPIAAAIAARIAFRRVNVSPLGVTRRVTPKPPRLWRVIPLLAGIAELTFFFVVGRPATTNGQQLAFFPGFLLIAVGLVLAGPWLTRAGAHLPAARSGRPHTLMAARRLADDPRAGFRSVSGLVLALFVTSVAVGVITTLFAYSGGSGVTSAQSATLIKQFFAHPDTDQAVDHVPRIPPGLTADLVATPGVRGATVLHLNPAVNPDLRLRGDARPDGVATCGQLATTPVIGRCGPGAETVEIRTWFVGGFGQQFKVDKQVWHPSSLTPSQVEALPVRAIVVQTDGSTAAIEAARTTIELAAPDWPIPETLSSIDASNSRQLQGYRHLASVIILLSLPIAGASLAVAVVGGLGERKRPFALLRLTGMPLATLRRVVVWETAVPLLVTAGLSVGVGFLAAHLFLRTQLEETLRSPGPAYYAVVAGALVAALGIIASTMPLLRRITGPETARND